MWKQQNSQRHRAIVTLAFGILGLTGLPLMGSIVAIVVGREPSSADDRGAEKMRRVGRVLGYVGVGIAVCAFVFGIVRATI
jgi:hypothetical protein